MIFIYSSHTNSFLALYSAALCSGCLLLVRITSTCWTGRCVATGWVEGLGAEPILELVFSCQVRLLEGVHHHRHLIWINLLIIVEEVRHDYGLAVVLLPGCIHVLLLSQLVILVHSHLPEI